MTLTSPLERAYALWRPTSLCITLTILLGGINACELIPQRRAPLSVERSEPSPARRGELLRLYGPDFGEEPGLVSISGRPLAPRRWGPKAIELRLPPDAPTGARLLVVSVGARRGEPFPIEVAGPPNLTTAPPSALLDRGPAPPVDQAPPRVRYTLVQRLQNAEAVVQPDLELTEDQQLLVSLRAEEVRPQGVAGQLRYSGPLRFVEATPVNGRESLTKEQLPGQLLFFRTAPELPVLYRFRFEIEGAGVGEISFPTRYRGLRDGENQEIEGAWSRVSFELEVSAEEESK